MDYEKVLREICAIYTQTGHGGQERTTEVCQKYLPDGTELTLRPSASIGCVDDLFFQRKGSGEKKILLMGHYDTVPGTAGSTELRKEGDKIFGLGTWDMKGGIVLALDLMNYLGKEDFASFDLLLTGDEENRTGPFQSPGIYDAVLAFEGGSPEGLVVSRFGAGVLEIKLKGNSLRAEYPLPKAGGLDITFDVHNDLRLMNTPEAQFTTAGIEARSVFNVVAPETLIQGVLRYKSIDARDAYLADIPKEAHDFKIETIFREVMPPLFASRESIEFCDKLEVYGVTRIGASDISWMNSSSRLLFDALGPFGGDDHTPNEYALLSSFERQARLGKRVVDTVLGRETAP